MRYFSMFSGIGGFELGIQQSLRNTIKPKEQSKECAVFDKGVSTNTPNSDGDGRWSSATCVGYSEIDKYAIKVYERNFNEHKKSRQNMEGSVGHSVQQQRRSTNPICKRQGQYWAERTNNNRGGHTNYGNATTINATKLPDFDLLVGGFPCQAFSIAGKRAGFDDTRGTLFFDIARIARAKQPMFILLENVKGLISHDKGKTLEVILETLQDMGYYVNYEVHNSKDFGVPQNRERIFFSCRHAKLLEELGLSKTPNISKTIIEEYLFQLLLNNLAEVKKLQETNSKEWVLGWLLYQEINQSLKSSDENISAGITHEADGMFRSTDEEVWQSIDTWLSKNLADGLKELSMSTISTAIKGITTSTTYTYSQMQRLIWLATVALKKSQPNLWQEVLSNLILIKEGTKYARLNNKKEEIIVTESGTAHIATNFQDYEKHFIVGHLGGEPRRKVFPITGHSQQIASVAGYISEEVWPRRHEQIRRTYNTDGAMPTIPTGQGGGVMTKIAIPVLTPNRVEKRQNDRRFKEAGDPSFTLTGQDIHGVAVDLTRRAEGNHRVRKDGRAGTLDANYYKGLANQERPGVKEGLRIRRLTPKECERLQGFPDDWTKYGVGDEPISDTQRYKMCGNAVTTNVITAVMERLI